MSTIHNLSHIADSSRISNRISQTSKSGFARDIPKRALAHTVVNKPEAADNGTYLFEQRRPMMKAWTAHNFGLSD
ncbi:MAG TPA: hypothetical protein VF534_22560 [Paraburkholderia sp.]